MQKYIIVAIIVVIVILAVTLFGVLRRGSQTVSKKADLNVQNSSPIFVNDTSKTFTLSVWMYVKSWKAYNPTNKTYYSIVTRSDKSSNAIGSGGNVDSDAKHFYSLRMKNSGELIATLARKGNTNNKTLSLTTTFPLQKWVYVTIVLRDQYLDFYMDGKLTNSFYLNDTTSNTIFEIYQPTKSSDKTQSGFYIGSQGGGSTSDINLGGVFHWDHALTPHEVWNAYLSGNPNPMNNNFPFSTEMVFLKNNLPQSSMKLF